MADEKIERYATIGDCRAAALVSSEGSIDWLCWPRFDSPPLFAAILDPRAGRWSVRPRGAFRAARDYERSTNVLRTRFDTDAGTLLLTDFMPVSSERDKRGFLAPSHEILRIARCVRGNVELETEYFPAPDFGRARPLLKPAGPFGLRLQTPQGLVTLRGEAPLVADGSAARGSAALREGETRVFSLSLAVDWPEAYPPLGAHADAALARSVAWWRNWVSKLSYDGPNRDAVVRSALALRLMLYAPSGAIIAAPTTSLPEEPGGGHNWDYRYCWLRDASMTVRALEGLGFVEDAEAFVSWLLHSTRLTRPALRVLYDVYGNKPPPETAVAGLRGFRESRPVRVGNAAMDQLQLDIYGELVAAAAQVIRRRGLADRETRKMLVELGDYVCRHWQEPDEGIWEPRSGRRHRTHSKAMCWAALERLLELRRDGLLPEAPAGRFAAAQALLRADIERRGWSPELGSYTAVYGERAVDASLLLLAWHGFEPASSERMRGTYAKLRERLDAGDGLLYRNEHKELDGEGAFGICGFWAADFLALGGGTAQEAQALFEKLCAQANDVGLFAEEIDPETKSALGNFPQAFTHVGLINAALSLRRRLDSGREAARA